MSQGKPRDLRTWHACKRFSRTAATASACFRKNVSKRFRVSEYQEMDSRGDVRNPSAFVVKAGQSRHHELSSWYHDHIISYHDISCGISKWHRVPSEDVWRTFWRGDALYYSLLHRCIYMYTRYFPLLLLLVRIVGFRCRGTGWSYGIAGAPSSKICGGIWRDQGKYS